ncbi:hypothetical protein [Streptomyces coeruleorubidus]|uniref:hypothetical protein n=1 Tax=Streptomyces coeruleorubidus TaxID=116188 RepID=UPI0036AF6F9B
MNGPARQLRRYAVIRLVQMSRGGSRAAAARYLGIAPGALQSATVTIRAWQKMPGNADAYQDALQRIVEIAAATEAPSSTRLTAPEELTVEPRTDAGTAFPLAMESGPGSKLGTPSASSEE